MDKESKNELIIDDSSNDILIEFEQFDDNNTAKGMLYLDSEGKFRFEGDFDESAKLFFEGCLKPLCDKYIAEKLKDESKKTPTDSKAPHDGN